MSNPTPRILFLDFDGTLLQDGSMAAADLRALGEAGRRGVVRVLATGRSLFSLRRAVPDLDLPVDHILFSTGGGVLRMADRAVIRSRELPAVEANRAARVLIEAGLDFMVHDPFPDNHRFAYHRAGPGNADFERRIGLYEGHCRPLPTPLEAGAIGPASQLLAVDPTGRRAATVRDALPDLSVILATSPLDGGSTWIEIFPPGVNKGRTAAWLASKLGIDAVDALAVGNDINDLHLLEWAGAAYVVADAHPTVRERFPQVPGDGARGIAAAILGWLDD